MGDRHEGADAVVIVLFVCLSVCCCCVRCGRVRVRAVSIQPETLSKEAALYMYCCARVRACSCSTARCKMISETSERMRWHRDEMRPCMLGGSEP